MNPRHTLIPIYLVLCVLLGGASLFGFVPNLALQLLALPIIVWALVREQSGQPVAARTLIWLAIALLGCFLVQLVPLPPALWTSLPGRERVVEGFAMLGQDLPWLALSLSPENTIAALLWLLPAFTVLLGIVRLGAYRSTLLAWAIVGIAFVSVLLAGLQLTGQRDFYLYHFTNFGLGVGFFANSNHQATLLLCALPFAAALYANRGRKRSSRDASGLIVALICMGAILVGGLLATGSLAGLGLGLASMLASGLLILFRDRKLPAWAPLGAVALLAGAVALIYLGPTSGGGLLADAATSTSSRATMVGTTAQAAGDFFPAGSGVGTFAQVYHWYEDPAAVTGTWVNHAHGDVVEILLETGLLGFLLMLAFLIWWGRRAWSVWRSDDKPDQFARAAVIASAGIIAHSFVDYPLRTAAISALFAACLALMAQPRPSTRAKRSREADADAPRHLSA